MGRFQFIAHLEAGLDHVWDLIFASVAHFYFLSFIGIQVKKMSNHVVLPCGVVPGECCALWYTGFTVKSSDFGTSGTRPSGPISILPKAESSRFTGSFGEDCCFGESLKVKKNHVLGREVAWYSWISLLHPSTKADIQLKPLNDTVKAVWDGTRSLWIHWWMKSGWIFWEFEFVWASAIGEFLSFRQPDFTMATVATWVFRELYIRLSFLSICRVWLYWNHI